MSYENWLITIKGLNDRELEQALVFDGMCYEEYLNSEYYNGEKGL